MKWRTKARTVSEIKGLCKNCVFLERELVRIQNEDGQLVSVEDIICGIFDVFKSPDGFCDAWESKE